MNEQPKVELLNSSQISQSDNFINFKIIIIGDSGVGKSSLLKRAVQNTFDTNYQATIGFEFLLMHFKVNDLKIKLQIWDTCGEEMYRSLVQGFYRNTSLAIIVYDISRKKSFEALEIWLKDLRQHTEEGIPVFIVGNKMDLQKDISTEEAKMFSVSNRTKFFTECSAKTGENVEQLLDMILLTADIDELKADVNIPAEGLVIESHMEVGKGSVVNLLVTGGELKTGEFIVAGKTYAKIRTMVDWRGKPKGKATPSTPVVVTGFKELPNFGDKFEEVADEKTARKMALLNAQAESNESASANVTSSDLLRMMNVADNTKTFNVIVKGDVQGSVTSVVDSLRLIDTQGEITLNIVSTGVGAISENDVYMASGGNTVIYGFNVSVPNAIAKMAERNGVPVRVFRVIYELLDDAKHDMEEMLDAEVVEEETGELEVKGVFRTDKTEIIAGGQVTKGRVSPGMLCRFYRKKELLGDGEVVNVQEGKVDVPSLAESEIGGLSFKTTKKIQLELGDRIEFFVREYKKKKIL